MISLSFTIDPILIPLIVFILYKEFNHEYRILKLELKREYNEYTKSNQI